MPVQEFTTEELEREEWRSVVGYYSGIYSVSNLGRVRRDVPANRTQAGRILGYCLDGHGYAHVGLSLHSQQRSYSVASLVIGAFVGPPPKGHNINHIDGKPPNNRLTNLEYVTFVRNSQHAVEMGLTKKGEDHGISKLTNAQVKEIKKELAQGIQGNQTKIAKRYGVNDTVISKIKRGEIWNHITLD